MTRWVVLAAAVLLTLGVITSSVNAGTRWATSDYEMDGDGTLHYPNSGWISLEAYDYDTLGGQTATANLDYTHSTQFSMHVSGYGWMNVNHHASVEKPHYNHLRFYQGGWHYMSPEGFSWHTSYAGKIEGLANPQLGSDYINIMIRCDVQTLPGTGALMHSGMTVYISPYTIGLYHITGSTGCLGDVSLYTKINNTYVFSNEDNLSSDDHYNFSIIDNTDYRLVFSDGAYYEFTCTGSDVTFDYDACLYVYGYTCGIDTIKLYDNNSQLIDTVYQSSGYDIYEMPIVSGEEYTISFYDLGIVLCYNQTFTCTGDHVHIDYDRCEWVYPPSPWVDPIPIYIWAGYDYNIVVFKDEHGNFIENSKLAIYDKTDNQYLQKWTATKDGYALLGARFAADHDVQLMLRTFDGVFTLDTTYPANGSAAVGEENITTTNWTIPIYYNLDIQPKDQNDIPLHDVFVSMSEYTPHNPLAFFGFDTYWGYVPVTNCSGFAMCDIIAEKAGYTSYNVTALNWTSKSALIKDYRHTATLIKE